MTGVSIKMRPPSLFIQPEHINENRKLQKNRYWRILDHCRCERKNAWFASKIADILSGKNKPEYTPNADLGDYVIIINAGEINVTGKKLDQKMYYRHSGYPGGIKSKPLRKVVEETPTEAIKSAVKGMLPKSKLGRQMLTKLKVYSDENHPHLAQKPIILEL